MNGEFDDRSYADRHLLLPQEVDRFVSQYGKESGSFHVGNDLSTHHFPDGIDQMILRCGGYVRRIFPVVAKCCFKISSLQATIICRKARMFPWV
jgi:hypothetical protein